MIDVVVAAYNEDISWIKDLLGKDDITIYIYYKGSSTIPLIDASKNEYNNLFETTLPNQGREAGTYLHHLTKHYDLIPEWNVFLQGDPMAHISIYDSTKSMYNYIIDICKQGPQEEYHNINTHFKYFHVTPFENPSYEHMYTLLPIATKFNQFFEGPKPNTWKFPAGAQFAVHKDAIHNRPLAFYQHLYDQVLNMANAAGGGDVLYNGLLYTNDTERATRCDAWTLECLWPHIFDESLKHHPTHSIHENLTASRE